jgi:YHS domain-containing protein
VTDTELTDNDTLRDPVCGMAVSPMTSVTSTEYQGTTYHFCSEDCYRTFSENPAQYVNA